MRSKEREKHSRLAQRDVERSGISPIRIAIRTKDDEQGKTGKQRNGIVTSACYSKETVPLYMLRVYLLNIRLNLIVRCKSNN